MRALAGEGAIDWAEDVKFRIGGAYDDSELSRRRMATNVTRLPGLCRLSRGQGEDMVASSQPMAAVGRDPEQ